MNKIEVMSDNLANKIAAGEVIEKIMNVVKELVENAIDAESSIITINLIDAGTKEIRVIDNGIGMSRTDSSLAFSRHATSKLKNLSDLFNISSLGFRGEALPSIAAVSNILLKTAQGEEGTTINLIGGKVNYIKNSALQKGTSIIVSDLFYNTPVRLKYLKNLASELASTVNYINQMALAHPEIKFVLTNNDKTLLQTTGDNNLLKVIYEIYGSTISKKMALIEAENDDHHISGYIGYPEIAKANRSGLITFVNGRIIKNFDLNRSIIASYHTYIPKERFPVAILNIDVDPVLIDVNIHPTKMDIKFSKFKYLEELIKDTITKKLKELTLIPNISSAEIPLINVERPFKEEIVTTENYEEMKLDFNVSSSNITYNDNPPQLAKLYPIGIVYATYIIAENETGMYIIDQHAAAERINYEKVLQAIKDKVIIMDLLVPIKIELSSNALIILKERMSLLSDLGFKVEEFGSNTIVVRSHPNWIKAGFEEEYIRKVIEIISNEEEFNLDNFIWKMAATMACRMSIKAHDYINREDQEYLLTNLVKCQNPYSCPHGRPTMITYTKYDLEKLFKRVVN